MTSQPDPKDGPREKLLAYLDERIQESAEDQEDENDASWGYETGVLLTRAQASLAAAALRVVPPEATGYSKCICPDEPCGEGPCVSLTSKAAEGRPGIGGLADAVANTPIPMAWSDGQPMSIGEMEAYEWALLDAANVVRASGAGTCQADLPDLPTWNEQFNTESRQEEPTMPADYDLGAVIDEWADPPAESRPNE